MIHQRWTKILTIISHEPIWWQVSRHETTSKELSTNNQWMAADFTEDSAWIQQEIGTTSVEYIVYGWMMVSMVDGCSHTFNWALHSPTTARCPLYALNHIYKLVNNDQNLMSQRSCHFVLDHLDRQYSTVGWHLAIQTQPLWFPVNFIFWMFPFPSKLLVELHVINRIHQVTLLQACLVPSGINKAPIGLIQTAQQNTAALPKSPYIPWTWKKSGISVGDRMNKHVLLCCEVDGFEATLYHVRLKNAFVGYHIFGSWNRNS